MPPSPSPPPVSRPEPPRDPQQRLRRPAPRLPKGLNYNPEFSDPGLNRREATVVHLVAEEKDVGTRLALILAFEPDIRLLVRREDNMASSDEEELVTVLIFGHTGARSIRAVLGRDGETERVSKRVANGYSWVGGEDGRSLEPANRVDGRLADFDVNVGDVELFKNLEAPKGRSVGVFTGERLGCHPDPKNDGGGGLSDHADANDVGACPLDPHLIQASVDLRSH